MMAISENQATNFINRTKNDYGTVMGSVQTLQAIAEIVAQETSAWGGAAAITAAIPEATWDATYPFTKAEFADILSNFAAAVDVLGNHGDLKPNLVKLRD